MSKEYKLKITIIDENGKEQETEMIMSSQNEMPTAYILNILKLTADGKIIPMGDNAVYQISSRETAKFQIPNYPNDLSITAYDDGVYVLMHNIRLNKSGKVKDHHKNTLWLNFKDVYDRPRVIYLDRKSVV